MLKFNVMKCSLFSLLVPLLKAGFWKSDLQPPRTFLVDSECTYCFLALPFTVPEGCIAFSRLHELYVQFIGACL